MSRKHGYHVALLIPATTGVEWFHTDVMGVAAEVWFFRQRIAFIDPRTGRPVKGSNFENMLVVFGPDRVQETFVGNLTVHGSPISQASQERWEVSMAA